MPEKIFTEVIEIAEQLLIVVWSRNKLNMA